MDSIDGSSTGGTVCRPAIVGLLLLHAIALLIASTISIGAMLWGAALGVAGCIWDLAKRSRQEPRTDDDTAYFQSRLMLAIEAFVGIILVVLQAVAAKAVHMPGRSAELGSDGWAYAVCFLCSILSTMYIGGYLQLRATKREKHGVGGG